MNNQMESESNEELDRSQDPVMVCQQCGVTLTLVPQTDVGTNESLTVFGLILNEEETYCLRCLQQQVKTQMKEAQLLQERYIYHKEFQSGFQQQEMARRRTSSCDRSENDKLNQQIAKLMKDQEEVSTNLANIRQETNKLKEKIFLFEVEQQKFWQGINKIERRTNKVEQKSLNTKFDKNQEKEVLDELSKLSIIHLFTDIVIDDNVALIQGMAMGKRSEGVDISWEEVAVGLGHLLITLNFLSMKYNYEYKLIEEIKLKGSSSEIILKNSKKRLFLWCQRDNEKLFGELLQTLLIQTWHLSQQILNAQNISYTQQFRIPFLINVADRKIAELFINPFKMEERVRWNSWTKAMRYFFINFKHMITVYGINDKYL